MATRFEIRYADGKLASQYRWHTLDSAEQQIEAWKERCLAGGRKDIPWERVKGMRVVIVDIEF